MFGLVPELSLRVDAIDLSIEMLIHPAFGYRLELLHRPGTGAGAAGKPANPAEAARREGYGHVAFDVADLDGAYDRAVARGARPVMPPCPAPEPGCGWRSSPTPRATSSNCCTGQGGPSEPNPRRCPRPDSGGCRGPGQTGGRCTLITAERPPRTMASASLSTWGSSPGSDTVTP